MAKIREDLEGVVYLADGTMLSAGDSVPEGVEVGDHLLTKAADHPAPRSTRGGKGNGSNASS